MGKNLKKIMRKKLQDFIERERESPILSKENMEKARKQLEALG